MSMINREVVHEGWLIKSPPTKRIWRARWRRRWFTLRHSGELPGQFFLEYYTDRNCRKLKGTIDLDQCEQVDAGLLFEQRKLKYPFMFDIKTPSRVYYLAAESEQDMNSWVDSICQVCGLKAYSTDGQDLDVPVHELNDMILSENSNNCVNETPPPLSPISGPYIPISECITGRPLTLSLDVQNVCQSVLLNRNATNVPTHASDSDVISFILTPQKRNQKQQYSISTTNIVNPNEEDVRFYDLPRQLQPFASEGTTSIPKWIESNLNSTMERATTTPPLQSPTDSESVFTDDEWSHPVMPSENGLKEPTRPSDSSIEVEPSSWSVVQRFGKLTVVDSPGIQSSSNLLEDAPPRPPKPIYLGNGSTSLKLTHSQRASRLKANKEMFENTIIENNTNHSEEKLPQNNATEIEQIITDETYDFPRSHNVGESETSKNILSSRHCYNNAAPTTVEGYIFRYDAIATENITASEQTTQFDSILLDEEPASPCSQSSCSTTANYSNLPSPLLLSDAQVEIKTHRNNQCAMIHIRLQSNIEPPKVNRTLKPGRKPSDSASIHSLQEPSSPKSAPNVDRKLKPSTQKPSRKTSETNELDHNSLKTQRAAPSPTPPCFSNREDESVEEQIYFYQFNNQFLAAPPGGNKDFDKLQYLDLDLEHDSFNGTLSSSQAPKSPGPLTVYKTVDFVKTEAFKRTRQCVEAARKKCNVEP